MLCRSSGLPLNLHGNREGSSVCHSDLSFPAELYLSVAGPEGAKNLAGKVLRLIQIRLATLSFEKISRACQAKIAVTTDRRIES
jgi:hypothetical protein